MSHPANVQAAIDRVRAGGGHGGAYLPADVAEQLARMRALYWPDRRWSRAYGGFHGESAQGEGGEE